MRRLVATKRLIVLCVVTASLAAGGCASSNQASDSSPRRNRANVITEDEIAAYTGQSLSELIVMKIAGVSRSGNGSLLIRGSSTFSGGTEPLYVLDGIPLTGEPVVNIKDLKEIEVLKGSDASMYGVRGANGVILISTKS